MLFVRVDHAEHLVRPDYDPAPDDTIYAVIDDERRLAGVAAARIDDDGATFRLGYARGRWITAPRAIEMLRTMAAIEGCRRIMTRARSPAIARLHRRIGFTTLPDGLTATMVVPPIED